MHTDQQEMHGINQRMPGLVLPWRQCQECQVGRLLVGKEDATKEQLLLVEEEEQFLVRAQVDLLQNAEEEGQFHAAGAIAVAADQTGGAMAVVLDAFVAADAVAITNYFVSQWGQILGYAGAAADLEGNAQLVVERVGEEGAGQRLVHRASEGEDIAAVAVEGVHMMV